MGKYRTLYYCLFGKVSNIIDAIDLMGDPPEQVLKQARTWLIQALQETEEAYLDEEKTPENQSYSSRTSGEPERQKEK